MSLLSSKLQIYDQVVRLADFQLILIE